MLQNLSVADILTDKGWWGLETSRPPPQGRGSVATHGGALGGLAKIVTGTAPAREGPWPVSLNSSTKKEKALICFE